MNSLLGVMRLNYLNKIFVLQKPRLHLIYFVDRKDHAIPLLVDAKILPITFLYYDKNVKIFCRSLCAFAYFDHKISEIFQAF